MPHSLPAAVPSERSLARVVPRVIATLDDDTSTLPRARSAIIAVVDGLGKANLSARRGHARHLTSAMAAKDSAVSVFPTTTASALTSLLTGTEPGTHGIVGYRSLIPDTDTVTNNLHGYEDDGLDPLTWQRATPLFQERAARGRPTFVVSLPGFSGTGFTAATVRGAEFRPAASPSERVAIAADLASTTPGALIYLYFRELDHIGHARGWESDEWSEQLENLDALLASLEQRSGSATGILVTADHGMVDVPRERQVLLSDGDDLVEGVHLIGGEPRMLHLYTEPGRAEAVHATWSAREGERSWILTRAEAVAAGLFGDVAEEVAPRIGDVLVAARSGIAYYDDRLSDKRPQRMVGQHGSLTDQERIVPLIRLGAYRR